MGWVYKNLSSMDCNNVAEFVCLNTGARDGFLYIQLPIVGQVKTAKEFGLLSHHQLHKQNTAVCIQMSLVIITTLPLPLCSLLNKALYVRQETARLTKMMVFKIWCIVNATHQNGSVMQHSQFAATRLTYTYITQNSFGHLRFSYEYLAQAM